MDKPKVMVCIPTNCKKNYFLGKLITSLKELQGADRIVFFDDTHPTEELNVEGYADAIRKYGFEVYDVKATKEANPTPRIIQRLVNTRNALREFFLSSDCTHMLFIDSDIWIPKHTIFSFLRHEKDIVSGVYFQNGKPNPNQQSKPYIVAFKYMDKESYDLELDSFANTITVNDLFPSRLIGDKDTDIHINAIGLGCVMLSRKLLDDKRWEFRCMNGQIGKGTTEDMWWSLDVQRIGYNIYLDSSILCHHEPKAWEGEI